MSFRSFTATLACVFGSIVAGYAQEAAALSGEVVDPSHAVVAGATVTLTDVERGAKLTRTTSDSGAYQFEPIPPGVYTMLVQAKGFADLQVDRIELKVRDRRTLRLEVTLPATGTSVMVEGRAVGISGDASSGTVIEGSYLENLPVNSRTVTSILPLTPGIVTGTGAGGDVNSNGQRSNTNYYMMDGLSMGAGLSGAGGFAGRAGGPPEIAGGGAGGTVNPVAAVSIDALQEIRVQTSAFAPEFGRTPGAQVSMISRGGSNALHGSAYEYFRNDRFNANDWFANEAGLARGKMRHNNFGGTIGGAVVRNKTFFFASADILRLQAPLTSVASVPDLDSRAAAPAVMRPYLRAFPVPNGPTLDPGAARFTAVSTNPQNRQFYSARLDHTLNSRDTIYVRYGYSPTEAKQRGADFVSPNVLTSLDSRSHSVTGAWTRVISASLSNDLRGNFSWNSYQIGGLMDNLGGAIPLSDAQVFPKGVTSADGSFTLATLGLASYSLGARGGNDQKLINLVESFTASAGSHTYKMGVDYRMVRATNRNVGYTAISTFSGLAAGDGSLLSGTATMASITSATGEVNPETTNYSAYIQDTWRIGAATTLTFGARWDVNPAPTVWSGLRPYALSSFSPDRVTQGEPLYDTRWSDVAVRVGMVKQIFAEKGKELVFRGGFGIFHDPGYGTSLSAFGGAPYANINTLTLPAFPLSTTDKTPPGLPATKPFGTLGAAQRNLQSPSIWQWNIALERSLGIAQTLSLGYVGAKGKNLLLTETQPAFSGDYDLLRLATNGADSSYHALQAQFRRRYSKNLLAQVAYTYSHSIDTASNDLGGGGGFATLLTSERGNSDFDVRHMINGSGSWMFPHPDSRGLGVILRDWWSDFMVTWRTGTSFDVVGISSMPSGVDTGRGIFAQVRPDYNGRDVWLEDKGVPGGKRLNRDAFTSPNGYAQGTLGRNSIGGFGLLQVDYGIRRQIPLTERQSLHLAVQAFNILNRPNFANPSRNEGANMTSANFGVSTRTQNQGFGGGSGSLLQVGGPRSLQFVVRYQF